MVGAIVRNDIVQNLIIVDSAQVKEMAAALGCEIVDAAPYGLNVGDLRTAAGWTRNAGGEQMVLEPLEQKQYDSYTVAAEQVVQLEGQVERLEEQLANTGDGGADAAEALAILSGEVAE